MGKVKTRLAASIGDNRASGLYQVFLSHLLLRLAAVPARRLLCFWPPESRLAFEQLAGSAWLLQEQVNGDLGARMADFFCRALSSERSHKAVLIGSDAPTLPVEYVQKAFELLDDVDVVLGPSTDGGYYLVAMRGPAQAIFDNIPWSTPAVMRSTIELMTVRNIRYETLPDCRDVDDLQDLMIIQQELRCSPDPSASDRQLLRAIERCLSRELAEGDGGIE